jgi:putative addiction module component (TIGR02574 family)
MHSSGSDGRWQFRLSLPSSRKLGKVAIEKGHSSMASSHKDIDYRNLSPTERILLAQKLWDSVVADNAILPTTPAHRAEIERRIALADGGEMPSHTWADVKSALRKNK